MKLCWRILVALHLVLVTFNVAAILILPFATPWYVSLPLLTVIANWLVSPAMRCPLTLIENHMRKKLGLPEITDFLDHYIFTWAGNRVTTRYDADNKPWRQL